jgi:hypothetical protein
VVELSATINDFSTIAEKGGPRVLWPWAKGGKAKRARQDSNL